MDPFFFSNIYKLIIYFTFFYTLIHLTSITLYEVAMVCVFMPYLLMREMKLRKAICPNSII